MAGTDKPEHKIAGAGDPTQSTVFERRLAAARVQREAVLAAKRAQDPTDAAPRTAHPVPSICLADAPQTLPPRVIPPIIATRPAEGGIVTAVPPNAAPQKTSPLHRVVSLMIFGAGLGLGNLAFKTTEPSSGPTLSQAPVRAVTLTQVQSASPTPPRPTTTPLPAPLPLSDIDQLSFAPALDAPGGTETLPQFSGTISRPVSLSQMVDLLAAADATAETFDPGRLIDAGDPHERQTVAPMSAQAPAVPPARVSPVAQPFGIAQANGHGIPPNFPFHPVTVRNAVPSQIVLAEPQTIASSPAFDPAKAPAVTTAITEPVLPDLARAQVALVKRTPARAPAVMSAVPRYSTPATMAPDDPAVVAAAGMAGSRRMDCPDCTASGARPWSQKIDLVSPASATVAATADMTEKLRALGISQVSSRRALLTVTTNQVRYFHAEDAGAATQLARDTGSILVPLTDYRPRPPVGTIELYIAAGHTPKTQADGGHQPD